METRSRMSPITALFLGVFGVIGVGILSGTSVALYGLRIADQKATGLLNLVNQTVDGLPELLTSLPPAIGDLLNDRRAPEYARNIDVSVRFVADEADSVRPVITVSNKGDEIVSLLAVRVAALNPDLVPVRDWTSIVATPLAVDDDWRGPLMPGATRHIVLHRTRGLSKWPIESLNGSVEISDVRVWQSEATAQRTRDNMAKTEAERT